MRSLLICALFPVLLLMAPLAGAQEEAPADEAQNDEEILETVPVDEGGTDSAPPPDEDESTTYSSIGLSRISADFDNVKEAINLDATLIGFRIPTVPWFAVELNLGFTIIPGEVTQVAPGSPGSPTGCGLLGLEPCPGGNATASEGEFGATTAGAFAILRSNGKFYAMGKYGYRYINANLPELQDERSGNAWGLGLGYRWNKKGSYAELGYLKLTGDIDALGFAVSYSYDRR